MPGTESKVKAVAVGVGELLISAGQVVTRTMSLYALFFERFEGAPNYFEEGRSRIRSALRK